MTPASITGLGCITGSGVGSRALWQAGLERRTSIRHGLGRIADEELRPLPEALQNPVHREVARSLTHSLSENKALLLAFFSAAQALESANAPKLNDEDGLILATTTGQIPAWDAQLCEFLRNKADADHFSRALQRQPLGALAASLCELLAFGGTRTVLTSACTASTQALALATLWLSSGRVKRCLVVGVEVLCNLTLEGFRSLQLLSAEPSTPFDRDRSGINLSEGAAGLFLERSPPPSRELARITGIGLSTDGFHLTSPHPQGEGIHEAMRLALLSAELTAPEINWVHAHGTGSRHNDQAEGRAISRLFGEQCPPVSSTKWLHGHALGASGAIETALCVEALRAGEILENFGLKTSDPELPLQLCRKSGPAPLEHLLKSTLGFGGANAALILSRANPARGRP